MFGDRLHAPTINPRRGVDVRPRAAKERIQTVFAFKTIKV
jgi:hypothetical protein